MKWKVLVGCSWILVLFVYLQSSDFVESQTASITPNFMATVILETVAKATEKWVWYVDYDDRLLLQVNQGQQVGQLIYQSALFDINYASSSCYQSLPPLWGPQMFSWLPNSTENGRCAFGEGRILLYNDSLTQAEHNLCGLRDEGIWSPAYYTISPWNGPNITMTFISWSGQKPDKGNFTIPTFCLN